MSSFDPTLQPGFDPPPAPIVPPPWVAAPPPPPRKPFVHPNFWWGILWCVGMLLFTQVPGGIVALIVLVVTGKFTQLINQGANPEQNPMALFEDVSGQLALGAGLVTAHLLIILLALLALFLVVGRDWPRKVAFRLPSLTHVLLTLASVPAFMVLANGVVYFLNKVLGVPSFFDLVGKGAEDMEGLFTNWPLIVGISVIGIMPAISEELWCRAFLGRGIVGKHGYVLGVLGTSLLFGMIHIDPVQGGMAAVLGIALHFVYLMSRSLLIPMLLHFMNNGLAVTLTRLPREQARLLDFDPTNVNAIYVYAAAGVLLLAVVIAFVRTRARLVSLDGEPAWQPAFPSVATPPPETNTRVEVPLPSVGSVLLVLVGLLAMGTALANQLGLLVK